MAKEEIAIYMTLYSIEQVEPKQVLPLELQNLLEAYKDIFLTPTILSPSRAHDQCQIFLLSDSYPTDIRSHRYPHYQKSKIECQL